MGWVALAVLAGVAAWLLRLLAAPRGLTTALAAALMLGAAGYAWQGRPMQPAARAAGLATTAPTDPGFVGFRSALLGDRHRGALTMADRALAGGDPGAAVRLLIETTQRAPRDAAAWAALGHVLARHDGGQLSPAARFAFSRAIALDPAAPGPPFFLGLAMADAGDLAGARTAWQQALRLTPGDAPYRAVLAERLRILGAIERIAREGRLAR
ncbi:tetratricopeptide repeat protein [Sphingomonas baiyangensis]|uniref:Cytochrome c-type biogenesis protein CcmH n=1 Tax=Sphingomonas baiyangensis TaxID=2572576 RepID=A0A4U1L269_9SPHN|nr:hypothetical protein [Sphingomonas baiyangensis]TKD50961.1 hypothetical protein FBR43_09475 [Sphingomonas baiyangensis]